MRIIPSILHNTLHSVHDLQMNLKKTLRIQQVLQRYYSTQIQVASSVPVIKIPAYVKKYLEQAKKKEELRLQKLRRRITYRGDTSFPVISSTDKQYTFYLGQIYNQNYPIPLQSKYWLKAKSSGEKFTIHPWDANPSLPVLFNEKHNNEAYFPRTFPELLTDEKVIQALQNKGYQCPTPIQVLTMPVLSEHRKHLLLAAETGCGKTVAYLAPIIQNIISVKNKTKLFPNTPLALIVTPGRELAEQIANVAYDLCRNTNLNVNVLVSRGTEHQHLKPTENDNVDILVASFGTLFKTSGHIFKLANLKYLVLDEADTLMDDSFVGGTSQLLSRIPLFLNSTENLPPEQGTQLILVSSTYPAGADDILIELFEKEDVVKIKSPYLHRVLCHVEQKFWRVDNDNRCGVLLSLVKSDYEKNVPVMIFSTHSDTCDWMSHFLRENNIPNVKFHGRLNAKERYEALDVFTNGLCNVMCCTDLASRGLDTQNVKHVINFDFPTSASDYILRVGRIGRVGTNQGYVTNLLVSKAGVYTLQEIERAVRTSERIPDVDANIKKKITKIYRNF